MVRIKYSANTDCIDVINNFFSKLGYTPVYNKRTEPAASGEGEVIKFEIPKFNPLKLEGKVLEEWRDLPLIVSRIYR